MRACWLLCGGESGRASGVWPAAGRPGEGGSGPAFPEEVSLATVFARALRGVIALTTSEERRVWPDAGEVLRTTPEGATAPASLVRLLQFAVLPEILGASAGPAIYLAASAPAATSTSAPSRASRSGSRVGLGKLEVELEQERVLSSSAGA